MKYSSFIVVVSMIIGICTIRVVNADDDRPCGPDWLPAPLRRCVPQEAGGADLRPACRAHDRCYEMPGGTRKDCDVQFRDDMMQACECADKPRRCRRRARKMYRAVRLFGGPSYRSSQP